MSIQSPSDLQWWRAGATHAILDTISREYAENKLPPKGSDGYENKQEVIRKAQETGRDDVLLDYLRVYAPSDVHLLNYPH